MVLQPHAPSPKPHTTSGFVHHQPDPDLLGHRRDPLRHLDYLSQVARLQPVVARPPGPAPTTKPTPKGPHFRLPLPGGLTEKRVAAALRHARRQRWSPDFVAQLQTRLGVRVTRTFDRATVVAVYRVHPACKGRPTRWTWRKLGLIPFREGRKRSVEDALVTRLKKDHPDGITVAVYPPYHHKKGDTKDARDWNGNAREIRRRARAFARSAGALGLVGEALQLGAAVAIDDPGAIITVVRTLHESLLAKHRASGGQAKDGPAPAWTKVKNLALFAHGMEHGLSLHRSGNYGDGVHKKTRRWGSNVKAFVGAMRQCLKGDVQVQLFACSAGLDLARYGRERQQPKPGDRAGKNSFGQKLANELGPGSKVFAHTTKGRTIDNPYARVFRGGQPGGGEHLFEALYPATFVAAEEKRLARVLKTTPGRLRGRVRALMWKHYLDRALVDHFRQTRRYREQPIGQRMFMDLRATRRTLLADWRRWIAGNLRALGSSRERQGWRRRYHRRLRRQIRPGSRVRLP